MRYTLLAVNTEEAVNIGDYIQALASSQFLPRVDGFIQREELDEYDGEPATMIMNGWYMHHPEHWPPSPKIKPLFYAFHINELARKTLLSPESLAYLKQYEPIGCRDTNSAELLNKNGVKAYFSGCMTLTLGYKFAAPVRDNKCYIVDAFHRTSRSLPNLIKVFATMAFKWKKVNTISHRQMYDYPVSRFKSLFRSAGFLLDYATMFTEDTLVNAEYICQQTPYYNETFKSEEALLAEAERLVRLYAKAGLVITSRIHCALPCLGLDTPVIYVEDQQQDYVSSCRLGGLKDFFNIAEWDGKRLIPRFETIGKISIANHPQNKQNWRPFANKMIDELKHYFSGQK